MPETPAEPTATEKALQQEDGAAVARNASQEEIQRLKTAEELIHLRA